MTNRQGARSLSAALQSEEQGAEAQLERLRGLGEAGERHGPPAQDAVLRRRLRPQQEHRGHDEDHRRAGKGHLGGARQDGRGRGRNIHLAAAATQPRVEVVRRGAEQVVCGGDEVAGAAEEAGEVGAGAAESEAGEFIRRGADGHRTGMKGF